MKKGRPKEWTNHVWEPNDDDWGSVNDSQTETPSAFKMSSELNTGTTLSLNDGEDSLEELFQTGSDDESLIFSPSVMGNSCSSVDYSESGISSLTYSESSNFGSVDYSVSGIAILHAKHLALHQSGGCNTRGCAQQEHADGGSGQQPPATGDHNHQDDYEATTIRHSNHQQYKVKSQNDFQTMHQGQAIASTARQRQTPNTVAATMSPTKPRKPPRQERKKTMEKDLKEQVQTKKHKKKNSRAIAYPHFVEKAKQCFLCNCISVE